MKKNSKKTKHNCFIWVVDPDEKNLAPDPISLEVLESQFQGSQKEIIPAYVAILPENVTLEQIEEKTNKYVDFVTKGKLTKAKVLPISGEKNPAKSLLAFAKRQGASLLAVSSRGNAGLKKLLFGSFAETLLKESHVPILFLTHGEERSYASQKVLFATDFSKESREVFQSFLNFSKPFAYEIIIYHLVTDPYWNITAATNAMAGLPEDFLQVELEERRTWAEGEAKEWTAFAKSQLPNAISKVVIEQHLSPIAPSILEIAKKENVGLIGMSTSVGLFEKTFFGSVAQDVFRTQFCPVWVSGKKVKYKK